jgi:homocysteine S-methyltransferase
MAYTELMERLGRGGIVILDGGTGTELERRGVPMSPGAWCGPATLTHRPVLQAVHEDYIRAGADVITANTYASSRLMLGPAGYGESVEEINRTAVETALAARERAGAKDVVVAGSLSHMVPVVAGTEWFDPAAVPPPDAIADAFAELAGILRDTGCEMILLEMMYDPDRMAAAFAAARGTGLPVWAGLSSRHGENGAVLGYSHLEERPFDEIAALLAGSGADAAGIMHVPSDIVTPSIDIIRRHFDGPLLAYPDSGHFKMPHWHFEDIIPPADFAAYAAQWATQGVHIIGGCCGLSPEHIAAIAALKEGAA